MTSNSVAQVKPLTGRERELAAQRAADIVRQRIGERPVRRTFEREHGALFGMLDALALVVFVAALAISSMHILQYMAAAAVRQPPHAPFLQCEMPHRTSSTCNAIELVRDEK
jgi:hypothetical protein